MPKSALQKKPQPTTGIDPIDKRTKNGKKLDVAQVIQLRDVQGLSFPKIGKVTGYDQGYIHRVYTKFKKLVNSTDISTAFADNRVNILNTMELSLLENLSKAEKLKKASLNNVAYAFNQIHTARRLEEGKGTGRGLSVTIEVAYQEATDRSRSIRLKHAGSSSTPMDSDSTLLEGTPK